MEKNRRRQSEILKCVSLFKSPLACMVDYADRIRDAPKQNEATDRNQ
jgi:hypothetical protein